MKRNWTEKQFQDAVVEVAAFYGWRIHHVRAGQTSRGAWLTAVQGHVGFPDLVLAHSGRAPGDRRPMLPCVIFAELKSPTGKLSDHQQKWADVLTAIPGVEYYLWRPDQFETISYRLEGFPWPN